MTTKTPSKDGTIVPGKLEPKPHQSKTTGTKHKQLDLSTTLVKMWEQFRTHKCANRAELLQNILTIIKGRVKEVSKSVGWETYFVDQQWYKIIQDSGLQVLLFMFIVLC